MPENGIREFNLNPGAEPRAIWVESGRAALAGGIRSQPIFLAWGTGDPAWDVTDEETGVTTCENAPAVTVDRTSLVNEIGRKILGRALYLTPDENGVMKLASGNYSISESPTSHLYLQFDYDYLDGGNVTIRELGIFVGCRLTDAAQAEARTYFTNEDFQDLGNLLVLENVQTPNNVSTYMRGSYEVVLHF